MRYGDFIDRVLQQGLKSREEAVKATEAVLETLGERLQRTVRDHLTSQVPNELKEFIGRRPQTDRFSLEEFYTRVSARSGVRYHHAVQQTKAVMTVLKQAVEKGQLEHMLQELPHEYQELFGESAGPLSPSV